MSNEPNAHVVCRDHGRVRLTAEEYRRQRYQTGPWKCPQAGCKRSAVPVGDGPQETWAPMGKPIEVAIGERRRGRDQTVIVVALAKWPPTPNTPAMTECCLLALREQPIEPDAAICACPECGKDFIHRARKGKTRVEWVET